MSFDYARYLAAKASVDDRALHRAWTSISSRSWKRAVPDLVDLPSTLPRLLRLLVPGGSYWFTINYDGDTIFSPEYPQDAAILAAYHQDMDAPVRYGRPAGDSQTGPHLFALLRAAGAAPAFAGASDWIVHPNPTRRAQLAAGDLVYLAHQLDFVGRVHG